jgi:hypothetical protein
MDEYDIAKELERHKCDAEAEAKMAAIAEENLRIAKEELKLGAKHRSLQRNSSFAARVINTKPKAYRARTNLHK